MTNALSPRLDHPQSALATLGLHLQRRWKSQLKQHPSLHFTSISQFETRPLDVTLWASTSTKSSLRRASLVCCSDRFSSVPNSKINLTSLLSGLIMRYQSWDILVFPERSKVPLQEFKTQCLVTRDHGLSSPPLPTAMTLTPSREPPELPICQHRTISLPFERWQATFTPPNRHQLHW
jgi:hypothetical protein